MTAQLATIGISALVGGLLVALLVAWRYSFRLTKLSLPFLDMEVSSFDNLSPVLFFSQFTMMVLRRDPDAVRESDAAAAATPVLLVHAGWNMVCEAFVSRFQAYPDDAHIVAAAAVIGGQNVQFVKMYRDIHTSAIRHSHSVTREFASDYLVRAPTLAERIDGVRRKGDGLFHELHLAASRVVLKK